MKGSSTSRTVSVAIIVFMIALPSLLAGCGALGGHSGGGGKILTPPVKGLTATAGNGMVNLHWDPYPGATSYNVARGTTSGGACPAGCNYITNGMRIQRPHLHTPTPAR